MGILDDAIREHLELKRQHGADDDDLDRLEKEAFGPPSRPGDPEFADQAAFEDHAEAEGSEDPTSFMPAQPPDPDPADDPLAVAPPETAGGEQAAPLEAPVAEPDREDEDDWLGDLDAIADEAAAPTAPAPGEEPPAAQPPSEELTGTERGRVDFADLEDTVDHPTVSEPPSEEPEAHAPGFAPTDPASLEPPEPPESAIFDQGDEEAEDEESHREEPATEVRKDPVEFTLDEDDEDLSLPLPDDAATEHELPEIEGEEEGDGDGEDLLEETPDFLQDAPEGERLWFEQGEPKDFDFDDD